MVFNIHMLQHIAVCVQKNGPLCCYTAYNMEDNIGHLVSTIHGTNDVIKQCTQKYILEKNLHVQLENSEIARNYYEKIESKRYSNRPMTKSKLTMDEKFLIQNTIEHAPIDEFQSIWIGKDLYRAEEREDVVHKRKTYDSFVQTGCGILGTIKSIFKTNCNSTYMLIRQDYRLTNDNICDSIKSLEVNLRPELHVVKTDNIKKAVLIKFSNTLAFSVLPNNIEPD